MKTTLLITTYNWPKALELVFIACCISMLCLMKLLLLTMVLPKRLKN